MREKGCVLPRFNLRLRRALSLGRGIFFNNPDLSLVIGGPLLVHVQCGVMFFSSPRGRGGSAVCFPTLFSSGSGRFVFSSPEN